MQKTEIFGLGELLIDFSPVGVKTNPVFEMNPGGSAANCMASCAALGARAEFAGAVGLDSFGDFLGESLNKYGIGTRSLIKRANEHTTLAFVSLDANAVPSYTFIKSPGAVTFREGEIDRQLIEETGIVFFSLVALSSESSREEALSAVRYAKKLGKRIGFDANYRERQWPDANAAIECMNEAAALADMIKASDNEAELMTGITGDYEGAAKAIANGTDALVCVTLGADGTVYYKNGECGRIGAYAVEARDTTGCGDAFMGALLFEETRQPEKPISEKMRFCCAAAAICATRYGGFPSMPSYDEVIAFMSERA